MFQKFECFISPIFTFTDHIYTVCKKLARFKGIMYNASIFIQELVTHANVMPIMSHVYGRTTETNLETIYISQKRIFGTILFEHKFEQIT